MAVYSDDDGVQVPSQLPLLPLLNQVLLPTAFLRITVPATAVRSVRLLEDLALRQGSTLLLAAVPALSLSESRDEADQHRPPRLDRLAPIGTAARVLQLSRLVQSGDWLVLLEGLCRVSITGAGSRPGESVDTVSVRQLELQHHHQQQQQRSRNGSPPGVLPGSGSQPAAVSGGGHQQQQQQQPGGGTAGSVVPPASAVSRGGGARGADAGAPSASAAGGNRTVSSANGASATAAGGGGAGTPADVAAAGDALKADTRRLLSLLTAQTGLPGAARLQALLDSVPPWRAADVVAAALSRTARERLAVLLALEHGQRIALAKRLVDDALSALGAAAGGDGAAAGRGAAGAGTAPAAAGGAPAASSAAGSRRGGVKERTRLGGGAGDASAIAEEDEEEDDASALLARVAAARPPEEVMRAAAREARRLRRGGDTQPGAPASRAYLELLAELPWPGGASAAAAGRPPPMALAEARASLDVAHHGLRRVKGRVLEHLAVARLRGGPGRAPVLCLIGPPGVGKTSLARSIAEVLRVPFARIALGGVRDEAEIRGHRRTYVGALPGRIISALRRAGRPDPLLLLDEVDKLGSDHRGDPASALLEVLDPEQNSAFTDAYLGLPYDLSAVTFVATANRASDIPAPLLDRLEVLSLGGYTLEEKVHICVSHLLPSLLTEHGLGPQHVAFPRRTLAYVATRHTREAGVRGLRRALAAVCRHVAMGVVEGAEADAAGSAAAAAAAQGVTPAEVETEEDAMLAGSGGVVTGPYYNMSSSLFRADKGSGAQLLPHLHHQTAEPVGAAAAELFSAQAAWRDAVDSAAAATASAAAAAAATATAAARRVVMRRPMAYEPPHSGLRRGGMAARGMMAQAASSPGTAAGGLLAEASTSPGVSVTTWGRGSIALAGAGAGAGGGSGGAVRARATPRPQAPLRRPADDLLPPPGAGSAAPPVQLLPAASALSAALRASLPPALPALSAAPPHRHPPSGPPAAVTAAAASAAVTASAGGPGGGGGGAGIVHPPHTPYPPDLLTAGSTPGAAAPGPLVVDEALVDAVLGPPRYAGPADVADAVSGPGAAAGLVVTAAGGGVQYVEALAVGPGSPGGGPGRLTLTGQAGGVLEESARIALSWLRAHARELGIDEPRPQGPFSAGSDAAQAEAAAAASGRAAAAVPPPWPTPPLCWDVHVHLPAGAVPKDGPSAGVTLAVALLSLLSGRPARGDTAMTGELTLRGLVLPVGGLRDKLLAARAAGVARALVPARNAADVALEVEEALKAADAAEGADSIAGADGSAAVAPAAAAPQRLAVLPVSSLEEVLAAAFDPPYCLSRRAAL